ncbi:tellurium resistance protein TerW [Dickeya lacustris]|uniref:Tellurium resistance protein TerW n=1 Tax=Dickeya lacustris TaxID=2259638 RepID=A0ABY8G5G4_9GAMM|nr:tellurium resistance protein TerW [Dickeya lacustris]WFN55178.1 tellurium resistance protein TerW [Dickeya lacustris]
MQLSTRQARIFRLAVLLGSGQPVPTKKIIIQLNCSEPTLTRALKELRETYSAEIKYSKATHSYQLTEPGMLDKKTIRRMNKTLNMWVDIKTGDIVNHVSLDKEKKKAVSLSLRMSILRKIDHVAIRAEMTRSDAVELLVERYIAELSATLEKKNIPK